MCRSAKERIENNNIRRFKGMDKPLFLISDCYPGIWLEHVYDSVIYARMYPENLPLAKNTLELFIDKQRENGQFPCYVWDGAKRPDDFPPERLIGYGQTQECVSFAALCLDYYRMSGDRDFLKKCFDACAKWEQWFRDERMTLGSGLVEMFYGYDTGHDNSGRLTGMLYHGNASEKPDVTEEEKAADAAPIIAVDMNCNFYSTEMSLAAMADELSLPEKAKEYREKAADVKKRLLDVCYDKNEKFFFDVDRHGAKRKYYSSTILHLFLEKVLDPEKDAVLIREICERWIFNPSEFWTPYPFPSMAATDPTTKVHAERNSWGYFSQALIALRCTRWMDDYGFSKEFDSLSERWLTAWASCEDGFHFGQELDPFTGVHSPSSEWYSSCMLFCLFAAKRLGFIE